MVDSMKLLKKYDFLKVISDLIVDVPTMNNFLRQLPGIIQRYIPVKRVIVFYRNDTGTHFNPYSMDIDAAEIPVLEEKSDIIRSFLNHKNAIYLEEDQHIYKDIFNKNSQHLLEKYDLNLIVPLYCRHYYRGMLVCHLEPKKKKMLEEVDRLIKSAALTFIPVIETERLEVENDRNYYRLFKFDRLVLLGEMVAAIAHELKTPMSTVLLEVQELCDQFKNDGNPGKSCSKIRNEIRRVNQFIRSLLSFSKFEEIMTVEINLEQFITKTLGEIPKKRLPPGMKIEKSMEKKQILTTDCNRLRQVFFNVLFNAFDAVGENGTVTINAYSKIGETGKDVRHIIAIKDNGPGIPDDIKEKILEPFFTTKSEGTGLGLYISYGIMRSLNGDLEIESNSNGTTVYIILPGD
jgi:two-component system, NtrC family, sensor kinase